MDFKEYMSKSANEKVEYFFNNLSPSNRAANYYVKWDKINNNYTDFHDDLIELNQLLGESDIKTKAKKLFLEKPNLLKTIPILIALRLNDKKDMDVMELDEEDNREFYKVNFKNIDSKNIDNYIKFIDNSGLFNFFKQAPVKNLNDYVYGVEVGMDTNARKNRSGETMEHFVEKHIKKACDRLNEVYGYKYFKYDTQKTSKQLKEQHALDIKSDKPRRKFDAVIWNEKHAYIVETNYYGGGGSKLKGVASEFTTLNEKVNESQDNATFIWITDGFGWSKVREDFTRAFKTINYVFNMEMVENNYIYELINK